MTDLLPNSKLLDLKDKVAIVTGGALGIGFGIVERFVMAGAKVVIADLDEQVGQSSIAKLPEYSDQLEFIRCDVSNEAEVSDLIHQTVTKFGSLDILVNNAGIYPNKPFGQMELADFQRVIDVNLKGVFLMSKYAAERMKKSGGGKIINITSIDALHPSMTGLAHYDASKHGVWGFTKNIAIELAQDKIWVNAIAPGGIATEGVTKASSGASNVDMSAAIEQFLAKIPMHRMGVPDEIGKVALFLASDMSSYMTGTQIVVDGGALLS